MLDIEPPSRWRGGKLRNRDHFTLGYHNFAWVRDEWHVMFARYDGTEARLYDVTEDPQMKDD